MRFLGYRSLKHPALPDPGKPDYDGQRARYWQESAAWWDNWEHNFCRSLVIFPALAALALALLFWA
jgi:hypothetical protein